MEPQDNCEQHSGQREEEDILCPEFFIPECVLFSLRLVSSFNVFTSIIISVVINQNGGFVGL